MHATPRKVISLFEPTHRYVIPIFQRHYVWKKEGQWEPLWFDIEEKMHEKQLGKQVSPHFLGAVILDSTHRSSTKEVSKFLVIDGQQRLTTLQILLTAIRDVSSFHQLQNIGKMTERCLLNPDVELMERPDQEMFKLWPTQANREIFCSLITAKSYVEVQKRFPLMYGKTKTGKTQRSPQPRDRLVEAYEYFYGQVNALCLNAKNQDQKSEALISIISVLKDDFTLVEIILDEGDDSQEIFNSLNGRGEPLGQSDLLRSYIFMRAEKNETKRDELYKNYWERFEDNWWDIDTKRGNQTSSHLDLLTRTLLSAKLGEPVDVRRVHSAYRTWIEKNKPYASLEEELKQYGVYADAFEQLREKTRGPLTTFGRKMTIWGTTTVFPLASYLYAEGNLSEAQLSNCLRILESFVVRRAICDLNNKDYNKYFIEVISKLRKSEDVQSAIIGVLLHGEGETRRFPADEEFKSAWISKYFYKKLRPDQLIQVFTSLETAVRSERAEHAIIPMLSVEHVMPQDWAENYPISGHTIPKQMNVLSYFSDKEEEQALYNKLKSEIVRRRELIHTIGNLTAVSQPLNSAMKNAKYSDKKKYFQESVLSINRYFDQQSEWSERQIEERAEKLFVHASLIWKYENSSA